MNSIPISVDLPRDYEGNALSVLLGKNEETGRCLSIGVTQVIDPRLINKIQQGTSGRLFTYLHLLILALPLQET